MIKNTVDSIILSSNGIEFMFNPVTGLVQIGMGGEWWSGRIDTGVNIIKHRKQEIDELYKPVVVYMSKEDKFGNYEIQITGGFGLSASFKIGDDFPKNLLH